MTLPVDPILPMDASDTCSSLSFFQRFLDPTFPMSITDLPDNSVLGRWLHWVSSILN